MLRLREIKQLTHTSSAISTYCSSQSCSAYTATVRILISWAVRTTRNAGARSYWLTAARYFGASLVGCMVVVYAFGLSIQAMLTHVPLTAVALASLGFIGGDLLKAVVASSVVSGLSSYITRDAR